MPRPNVRPRINFLPPGQMSAELRPLYKTLYDGLPKFRNRNSGLDAEALGKAINFSKFAVYNFIGTQRIAGSTAVAIVKESKRQGGELTLEKLTKFFF